MYLYKFIYLYYTVIYINYLFIDILNILTIFIFGVENNFSVYLYFVTFLFVLLFVYIYTLTQEQT